MRVLLVDDHPVVRRGLSELLSAEEDIEVVGAACDADEAVALDAEHRPDVVLMDLAMKGEDGISATRRIIAQHESVAVVVLTTFVEHEKIVAALDAGAVGYMLKDAEPEELVRAVRAAASGDSPISPRAARMLLTSRQPRREDTLTDREREVLALVAVGLANKQIARRLEITERTVKAHLTHVYAAIGVADRTQAALWAERHGIRAES